MNSRVFEHDSACNFLDACAEWLTKKEVINHGLLSLADTLERQRPIYIPPFRFYHIVRNDHICGCCIFAEPDGLVLSEFAPNAPSELFVRLKQSVEIPSRIFGPTTPTLEFADLFAERKKRSYRVHSTWRVHQLKKPSARLSHVEGYFRIGNSKDRQLVSEWGKQYDLEKPANVNIERFLCSKLDAGELYLWIDDKPRCLASISGTNCSGPRVSAVFTPREMRGRGYAASLVHELSNKFLNSGSSYVTLATQVGDPSERIYKKLGYKPVGEKLSVVFD